MLEFICGTPWLLLPYGSGYVWAEGRVAHVAPLLDLRVGLGIAELAV